MNNLVSIAPLQGDYLAHHQIKGAHWGILHGPPYPLARGKGPKKIKKASKEAIKRVEKQAEEGIPGAEKKKAELHKYVVEHPKKLYKHKDMFSREELEDILKEIDFDRKFKDVKRNEFKRFVDNAQTAANMASNIKNISESAIGIYKSANTIKDILNKSGDFAPKKENKTDSNLYKHLVMHPEDIETKIKDINPKDMKDILEAAAKYKATTKSNTK